jgi:7-dehydrocholesterol reductase
MSYLTTNITPILSSRNGLEHTRSFLEARDNSIRLSRETMAQKRHHSTVRTEKGCHPQLSSRLPAARGSSLNPTTWGRASNRGSWPHSLISLALLTLSPLLVVCSYITLAVYDGSLAKFLADIHHNGLIPILWLHYPRYSAKATVALICWTAFQAALFLYLPGPNNTGQMTPAGHILTYRTNGLNAWFVTHLFWAMCCGTGLLDPGFITKNWEGLVFAMNVGGILLALFAYLKACVMPTHAGDRKFSGNWSPLSLPSGGH